jgi:uncharacterized protein (DUF4213/DUF364 family)
MTILNDLIASLPVDVPVRSVIVSAYWTVVCSRHCGMSAALRSNHPHGNMPIFDIVPLHRKSARELAELAYSTELLEASIGVAAINSMLDIDESRTVEMKASEVLSSCGHGKDIALIGRFHFIPQLRQIARRVWVIEQQPAEDEYPVESAVDLLPRADVVAITGSTLVNHTLDELLALCKLDSTVIVLGPSTPFSPVLFDHRVNIICGTRIVDELSVLRTLNQSKSLGQVEGVKLLTFAREKKI